MHLHQIEDLETGELEPEQLEPEQLELEDLETESADNMLVEDHDRKDRHSRYQHHHVC